MSGGKGVETVSEIDVIDNYVEEGAGLLVASRIPSWFKKGASPGAINIPFTTLSRITSTATRLFRSLVASKPATTRIFLPQLTC